MRSCRVVWRSWFVWFLLATASGAATYDVGRNPPFASALLVEAETGAVLFEYKADVRRSPASTVKVLLELVVMDAVAAGHLDLADSIRTSEWASQIGGSQVFLREGEVFPLNELLAAVAIASANDACGAIAEHVAGTSDAFVALMNDKARSLGLRVTRCVNVHGLDDTPDGEGNVTTARELATIARALLRHPQALGWSSQQVWPFRGGRFMLHSTNGLLGRFEGMDGLKTGYTGRARFNLVATAERRGMRLLSVILGARSERDRSRETARLLSWGFQSFVKEPIALGGESVGSVRLDWGLAPDVRVVVADTVVAVLTPEERRRVRRVVELPPLREAPVTAGDPIGVVRLSLDDRLLARVEVVAGDSVARMTLWEKLLSYF